MIAFFEGLLRSHHLAFFFLNNEYYDASPMNYSVQETVITLIFVLKPFMGYFIDTHIFCGYLKKSYLVLVGVIGTILYLTLT